MDKRIRKTKAQLQSEVDHLVSQLRKADDTNKKLIEKAKAKKTNTILSVPALTESDNLMPKMPEQGTITLHQTVATERENNYNIGNLAGYIKEKLYELFPSNTYSDNIGQKTIASEPSFNLLDQMKDVNSQSQGNVHALQDILDFINQYA